MTAIPFISFYIPTYNRSDYLREAILSLIDQPSFDPKSMEIVVCDDASTDDTHAVISSLKKKHPCIKYIHNKKNLGIDGNIYNAFNVCTGKYIWLMGDDDIFYPNSIHTVLDAIHAYSDAYVFHINYDTYNKDMTTCTKPKVLGNKTTARLSSLVDLYDYGDYGLALITYLGVVFRNDIDLNRLAKRIPETFFPHSCIRSLIPEKPMVFIGDCVIKYRTNNSDFSTAYSVKGIKNHWRIWIVGYLQFVRFSYKNNVKINYARLLKPYIFIVKWFVVLVLAFVARKLGLYNMLLPRWRISKINIFK